MIPYEMSITGLRRRKFGSSFGWGKFGGAVEIFPMKRGLEDHPPSVWTKFSHIASSETLI
jgi:hypothetical protein